MWKEQARDTLVRARFSAMCCLILWAFWGLVQLANANTEYRRLTWAAPDPEAVAMLTSFAWDDDPPECPKPTE